MSFRFASCRRAPFVLAPMLALATLCLTAAPAQASQIHIFSKSFTLPGSAGPIEPAINQSTEEVYVSSSSAVYAFEASGTPDPTHPMLTETDGTTPYPFVGLWGIAVDNTAGSNHGDIYVDDQAAQTVLQFNPSGVRTGQAPISDASIPPEGTPQSGGLQSIKNNGLFIPNGVAVGPEGDIFVTDQTNGAYGVVDRFQANGTFVSQLGAEGNLYVPNAIAFGPSGNLYAASYGPGLVEFEPSGSCYKSCAAIDPTANLNLGVATDPEGNLYAEGSTHITELNSSTEPFQRFGEPEGTFSGLSSGRGIAVNDNDNDIYVASEGTARVDVFEPRTVPTVTTGSSENPNPGEASVTVAGKVDPDAAHGGGPATQCHFQYGVDTSYSRGTVPCLDASNVEVGTPGNPITSETEVHAELSGLSTVTTYHYRLAASDANEITSDGADQTLQLLPFRPVIDSTSSSGITSTGATLSTEINPGFGATDFRFQYGATTSYEDRTPPALLAGADGTDHTASAELSELMPGTTYHFRAIATNFSGTSIGTDQTFTTPDVPQIGTSVASEITGTSATLNAEIDPELSPTTYHFEYGTSQAYGVSTDESSSIGADDVDHAASSRITSLTPVTTYHFRVFATNAIGVSRSFDQSFTTGAASEQEKMVVPPPVKCHKGFVRKHGKCIRKSNPHHKKKHNHRGGKK